MYLNRLFFIFYRLIEKFTSIRPESYILYSLFVLYFFVFFRKFVKPLKRKDFDKRELWEKFRFKNVTNLSVFEEMIKTSLLQGPINFENTMEISIRGHYILKGKFISDLKVKAFLHFIFFANLICPDLYLKREGILFKDRSNNHQFYVLFYNFKFLKLFYNIDSSKKLLNFVEVRLKDGMLNEGSTFYHLGVMGCVNELISNKLISKERLKKFPKLRECLENFDSHYKFLLSVNFGDRDGTYLAERYELEDFNLSERTSLLKSIYIRHLKDDSLLFINKIKNDDFGSGGHFHDDYGHLVIQKKHNSIVHDIGIYKYEIEPMYCRREFHNLPFFIDTPGVEYKEKFLRMKRHKTFCKANKYYIMFCNKYEKKSIRRYFLFKTKRVIDIAVGSGNVENLFALDFDSFKNGIHSQSFLQFEFSHLYSERLDEDFYYPEYSVKKKCMHYKLKWSLSKGSKVYRLMKLKINV